MARQAELGLLGLFFAFLLVQPLPLAGNRPWAVAWLSIACSLLLAAALWVKALQAPLQRIESAGGGGVKSPSRAWLDNFARAAVPIGLLLLFAAWVFGQRQGWLGVSADPHETRNYFLRSVLYIEAFLLTLVLIDTNRRCLALFYALLFAGIVQALLAIGLLAMGASYNLAGNPMHHAGRALGTFANADHLANYLAMILSAGVGLMLSGMGQSRRDADGWQARLHGALEFMLSVKMLIRLMLVLLVIVLVLTRSRMGNAAFFLSLLLLGCWTMWRSASLRKPAAILVLSLLVVDVIVIGQWVGLEKVVKRLEATDLKRDAEEAALQPGVQATSGSVPPPAPVHREESFEERMRAPLDGVKLVEAKPWTGWGGGSFYVVFPHVKREELKVFFDHAHNDYVEIAAETGLPGLAMLAAVFVMTFVRVVRLTHEDQPAEQRGLALGVGMAMLCVVFHAVVDFNLQIPANAITLTILLAATWGMPLVYRKRRSSSAPN